MEVTAKLGVTTDLTADQAADALGRIGNILNLTAEDYDNFGSALILLGNKGAAFESEIIDIVRRFGAAGKTFGLTTAEILGLAEATASFSGLHPERAGSSLVRLMEGLTNVVAQGGSDFKTLNELVGTDFKKAIETDASGAITLFLSKIGELDQFERLKFLKELGLSGVGLSQLLAGLSANVDDVGVSFANADAGWAGNFLNEEAAEKFKTLASQLKVLKNNIFDAGITIGTEMLPALKRATDRLVAFLKQPGNQEFLKSIGRDVGEAIDKIDWGAVAQGAKTFVGLMKSALDWTLKILQAIQLLPTEIKAAGAAFIGLNKLSGGLIGAGAGNIFGGALEGILRKVPKVGGGLGRLFAQPVFVTNWPPGMGLGGGGVATAAKGGLGLASKVFLVGEAIGLALLVKEVADNVTTAAHEQAQTLHTVLNESLTQPQTGGDLQTKLAGIDKGIADIKGLGNIPEFLFQDTLRELQLMRTEVVAAIAAQRAARASAAVPQGPGSKRSVLRTQQEAAAGHHDRAVGLRATRGGGAGGAGEDRRDHARWHGEDPRRADRDEGRRRPGEDRHHRRCPLRHGPDHHRHPRRAAHRQRLRQRLELLDHDGREVRQPDAQEQQHAGRHQQGW